MSDLIEREDAIEVAYQLRHKPIDEEWDWWLRSFNAIPSADRPQGEWKHLGGDEWLCSECGYVIWTEGSWEHPLERGKDYCEHCGARMKGADDETD